MASTGQVFVDVAVRCSDPFEVLVCGEGELPYRGKEHDAGHDLYCHLPAPMWLEPGDQVNVPCGVRVELPTWTFGLITPRSSTMNRGLHVVQGVIDPGYRGELFARVVNIGRERVTVRNGERLAQLLVLPNLGPMVTMRKVDALSESDRGEDGFGSTGR